MAVRLLRGRIEEGVKVTIERNDVTAIPVLDVSSRAGLLLAATYAGLSSQPNLLTRGTRDQAIITGVATAVAYGWGSTSHSFLQSVAMRLPIENKMTASLIVDSTVAVAGLTSSAVISRNAGYSSKRAVARLVTRGMGVAALAGLGALALSPVRERRGSALVSFGAMAGVGLAAWASRWEGRRTQTGSQLPDGSHFEDTVRHIDPGKAALFGVATGGVLYGLARGESALSSAVSRAGAAALGGSSKDHRTLGRLGALAVSWSAGWAALSMATAKLGASGEAVEIAYEDPPTLPEVTGSPQSEVAWDVQSREGARWLGEVLLKDHIAEVMGEAAHQPIRVYASLGSAPSAEERVEVLLRELERTKAYERDYLAVFSPTGSGYVNYVACETFEYLTRGNCASAAIEYSVLPSSLSLTKTKDGALQTRLLLDGISRRLRDLPPDQRPKFVLFGESLGSNVSQEVFLGESDAGPLGVGLDAAVWVGTPAFTEWRKTLWAERPQSQPPTVGPGSLYLPRSITDWHALSDEAKSQVRFLLLQNGDDPIPKFEAPLLWKRPDWLGSDDSRPPGAPIGTTWIPVVSFMATFIDMLNALTPTPGRFAEGGHDYRVEIPGALRQVWGLEATDEQLARVVDLMQRRELAWEVKRQWTAAHSQPSDKRQAAVEKVQKKVAAWTGSDEPLSAEQIQAIIAHGLQPTVQVAGGSGPE